MKRIKVFSMKLYSKTLLYSSLGIFVLYGLSLSVNPPLWNTEHHPPLGVMPADSLFQARVDSLEPLINKAEHMRAQAKRLRLYLDTLTHAILELENTRTTEGRFLVNDVGISLVEPRGVRRPRRHRDPTPLAFMDSIPSHNVPYADAGSGQRLLEWKNQQVRTNQELDSLESQLAKFDRLIAAQDTLLDSLLNGKLDGEAFRIEFRGGWYKIFIATSVKHKAQVHDNQSGKLQSLAYTWDILQQTKHTPVLLANGGMYLPNGAPVGLLIENQRLHHPLNRDSLPIADNFHLYPNGVFGCDQQDRFFVWTAREFVRRYPVPHGGVAQATQSGPMLVINGGIHPAFNYGSPNTNIRNGVGIVKASNQGRVAFVLSENRINLYDFALLFKVVLKCDQALYLDGVISKMYAQGKDKYMGDLGGSLGPVISLVEK